MDNLESQNDNIHSKLKELLESNREIRKEMASLGMSKGKDNENQSNSSNSSNSKSSIGADLNQQFPNLNINNDNSKSTTSNVSSGKATKS